PAASGSRSTATTTSTACARRRCSCARCGPWVRTWTGTCPTAPRTDTASARTPCAGSRRAGRACLSRPTARSRPSRRSRWPGRSGVAGARIELARRQLEADLDLVALATIADVVPLLGENRALVRRGLRALAATSKPGLRALMAAAGVDASLVDERSVAFALAP